jgi:hypothetical protein
MLFWVSTAVIILWLLSTNTRILKQFSKIVLDSIILTKLDFSEDLDFSFYDKVNIFTDVPLTEQHVFLNMF